MKTHIMLIYRRMIPSIQLCGHSQLEYLNRTGAVEYRACQEMELDDEKLNWADVVLLGMKGRLRRSCIVRENT